MKKTILAAAALMLSTASAYADFNTVCLYQANGSIGHVDVKMTFTQDDQGRPKSGKLQYYTSQGVNEVRIPGSAIKTLDVNAPGDKGELQVNVHVRSRDVDMVLNYEGNNLLNDALGYRWRTGDETKNLLKVYKALQAEGGITHNMFDGGKATAQMTGSVNWQGQLTKIASKTFVCSSVAELPNPGEEEPGC